MGLLLKLISRTVVPVFDVFVFFFFFFRNPKIALGSRNTSKMSAALFGSIACAVQRTALARPVAALVTASSPRRAMSDKGNQDGTVGSAGDSFKKPEISTSFNRNNSKSYIRNTRKKKRKRRRRRRTTERRKQTEFNLRIFLHPKNVLSSTQMTIHSDNDLLFDSSEFPTFLRFIDD